MWRYSDKILCEYWHSSVSIINKNNVTFYHWFRGDFFDKMVWIYFQWAEDQLETDAGTGFGGEAATYLKGACSA